MPPDVTLYPPPLCKTCCNLVIFRDKHKNVGALSNLCTNYCPTTNLGEFVAENYDNGKQTSYNIFYILYCLCGSRKKFQYYILVVNQQRIIYQIRTFRSFKKYMWDLKALLRE